MPPAPGDSGEMASDTERTSMLGEDSSRVNTNATAVTGIGIGCIGALSIYYLRHLFYKTTPQVLLGSCFPREPRQYSQDYGVSLDRDVPQITTLALVNFPPELSALFEYCFRSLVTSDEVEILHSSVVFYDEVVQLTPHNIESVLHREVLDAFTELHQCHCAMYRSVLVIDDEVIDPFLTPSQAVSTLKGRAFHERHCLGFTVDGSRVEILVHDVHGRVGTSSWVAPRGCGAEYPAREVVTALRERFRATTRTFFTSGYSYSTLGSFPSSVYAKQHSCPYSNCFRSIWLGPAPLFALFAAAVRFGRTEFDGWRRLAMPREVPAIWTPLLSAWNLLRGVVWESSPCSTNKNDKKGCRPPFLLEVHISQSVSDVEFADREVLETAINSPGGGIVDGGVVEVSKSICAECGAVFSFHYPASCLTVFQALRDSWRLVGLIGCLNYDVVTFRLLTPVISAPPISPSPEVTDAGAFSRGDQTDLYLPAYPASKEDIEKCPSFFCSSQYFCLVSQPGRIKMEEAFRRIRSGIPEGLHYVIVEYFTKNITSQREHSHSI
ncbi:hypothetical protein TRVL_03492 [Trypanosoma vivax]|nr:hypothetical protein TRVL_03492 [Trypanosoma vivax]